MDDIEALRKQRDNCRGIVHRAEVALELASAPRKLRSNEDTVADIVKATLCLEQARADLAAVESRIAQS